MKGFLEYMANIFVKVYTCTFAHTHTSLIHPTHTHTSLIHPTHTRAHHTTDMFTLLLLCPPPHRTCTHQYTCALTAQHALAVCLYTDELERYKELLQVAQKRAHKNLNGKAMVQSTNMLRPLFMHAAGEYSGILPQFLIFMKKLAKATGAEPFVEKHVSNLGCVANITGVEVEVEVKHRCKYVARTNPDASLRIANIYMYVVLTAEPQGCISGN